MKIWLLITALLMPSNLFPSSAAVDTKSSHAENAGPLTKIPDHIEQQIKQSSKNPTATESIMKWLEENPQLNKNARSSGGQSLLTFLLLYSSTGPGAEDFPLRPVLQSLMKYQPMVTLEPELNELYAAFTAEHGSRRGTGYLLLLPEDIAREIVHLYLKQGHDWDVLKKKILQVDSDSRKDVQSAFRYSAPPTYPNLASSVIKDIEDEIAAAQKMGEVLDPYLLPELIKISKDYYTDLPDLLPPLIEISQSYHTNLLKREKKKANKTGEKLKSGDKN